MQYVLNTGSVYEKLSRLEATCQTLLVGDVRLDTPMVPGRDVRVVPLKELPPKAGLSYSEGQARLLHDLASIELQAMELGVRTLCEFPEAPQEFKEQLVEVTLDEGRHLRLCLEGIEYLGYAWGDWPVHIGLWQAVSAADDLLDRVLIVHRYLEGSGLDAGDTILRRLSGVTNKVVRKPVEVIAQEEMGHVQFGSKWFKHLCAVAGMDPNEHFVRRLKDLSVRIPRRLEKINVELRRQAGFSEQEIDALMSLRENWLL